MATSGSEAAGTPPGKNQARSTPRQDRPSRPLASRQAAVRPGNGPALLQLQGARSASKVPGKSTPKAWPRSSQCAPSRSPGHGQEGSPLEWPSSRSSLVYARGGSPLGGLAPRSPLEHARGRSARRRPSRGAHQYTPEGSPLAGLPP